MSGAAQHTYTAKNGKLSVIHGARIPLSLLRLLFGDANSSSNSYHRDSDDGDDSSATTTTTNTSYTDTFLSPNHLFKRELARSIYALSMDGSHLAVAHDDRYMLLERPEDDAPLNYRLVSVGSDAAFPGESVTSLYCMSVYTPHGHQKQGRGQSLCVAVGYSSGYLRIFSLYGHLLTTHQFHPQALIRIRLRMPSQVNSAQESGEMRYTTNNSSGSGNSVNNHGVNSAVDDAEEVCLTYTDGTMVSIDGKSLYLALRLCLNEASSAESDEPMFQYKKWAFDLNTPLVSDAVSYGPSAHRDPLASLAKATMTSSPLLSDATARFLVAPQHGDAAFGVFMTNEDAAMSFSAVDIAGKMAARVTGAVLSIAKSYFWRTSSQPSSRNPDSTSHGAAGISDPGTLVPCAFAVRDSPRKVLNISLAPAQYSLATLTDSLGRVLVFDLESCEIIHMLKGLRGSQCAWLETESPDETSDTAHGDDWVSQRRRRMFIVIYAGKRGTVEVFELGSLERSLASVSVGLGWKLVQCPTQPLGGSLVVGSAGSTRRAALPSLASCMLLNESGHAAHIQINI
ncbi:hypothetical protein LPJ66_003034 [Kickxella alabastrina]|uniref:Uncharacterized protein n=1 Tax=Kickxella alabastrina TaxID=61397 RepID=A0ACC1ILV6_9FUNG|nr:hypothetical protein LPJ66_003034 [Kickxella alabastrina]